MKVNFSGKTIEIKVKKVSLLGKFLGLMFKTKNTKTLLFNFNKFDGKNIHSLFVFFPFLAVWLDENNKVIKREIVRPFTLLIKAPKKTKRLIEIPLNKSNKELLSRLVDKREKFK